MSDHEHTPPTEAELDEREEYMRGVAANLPQVDWPRHALNAYAEVRRLRADSEDMRKALRSVGIFRSDEAGDDGSEWCVTGEPHGEEPVGTLTEALRALLDAARQEFTP